MTLGELIKILEELPQDAVVPRGFHNPHSWRGIYAELAFEPKEKVRISEMLADAKSAVGTIYEGWKGGDFPMGEYTEVHISERGTSHDLFQEYMFAYMRDWIFD